jgi:hypothetical protein
MMGLINAGASGESCFRNIFNVRYFIIFALTNVCLYMLLTPILKSLPVPAILGHLAAVNDLLLPLLRMGESIYPELQPAFVDAPDKAFPPPPTALLRIQWKEVNEKLLFLFNELPAREWFTRHANIMEDDFIKEPHRNRLNVLLGRTMHLSYHRGQLMLLIKKTQL